MDVPINMRKYSQLNYSQLNIKEIDLICDYLRNPSKSKIEDKSRRKKLYEIGFHRITKTSETNGKFYTGPLGEGIVRLYYQKLDIPYIDKVPKQRYVDKLGEEKNIKPDGLIDGKVKNWVESKMRAYQSEGTANEKIPSVPRKYKPLGGKLTLFLMADDEHQFNKEWYGICRGEIKPQDEIEENWKKADNSVLYKIVLGTEVANILDQTI